MLALGQRLAAAYRSAFSGLPRPIWLLAIASLVNRSGTMVLPFATLYLTEEKGWSATQAGLALTCYGAGAMVGSFGGGWLCDRVEAVSVLRVSLVANGLGFFVLEHLGTASSIYPFLTLLGLVSESFRPANATALTMLAEPAIRVRAFSLYRLAINLGMSIGPVIGGFLAERDYRLLFRVDGATSLAAAAFLVLWVPRVGVAAVALDTDREASGRSPWRDRPFLALLGLSVVLSFVFFQLQSTYPLALHRVNGFSEGTIGLLLAINTVIIVAAEMLLAHALRDVDHLRLVAWGSLLFGLGLGLLPLGMGALWVAFTIVIWTFGEMFSLPFLQGVASEMAEGGRRGTYLGLLSLSFSLSFLLGPLIGAWIFERYGSTPLWLLCLGLGVLLFFSFSALARARRVTPPRAA